MPTEAMVTDMNAPLGRAIGNAVEVIECIETLKGRGPADLTAVVVALGARMLVRSGLFTERTAEAAVRQALASGAALEKLRAMIEAHGGDSRVVDDYSRLRPASGRHAVKVNQSGYVAALHADLLGRASMALGAGRQRIDDPIDHGAGVIILKQPGERVEAGETVVELLYNDARGLVKAAALAEQAIHVDASAPAPRALVLDRIG
jgi:thymidine phosphorylase